jgi:hypothetical protein
MDWHDVNGTYDHSVNGNKGRHKKTSAENLPSRCVEAMYLSLLLEEGFGFDLDQRSLTLALKVEGVEVEWTLGVLLTKAAAHAANNSRRDDVSEGVGQSSSEEVSATEEEREIASGLSRSESERGEDDSGDSSISELNIDGEAAAEMSSSEVEAIPSDHEVPAAAVTQTENAEAETAAETAAANVTTPVTAMEAIYSRIRALKASGLPASTLKKLFPDVTVEDFFGDEDPFLEGDDDSGDGDAGHDDEGRERRGGTAAPPSPGRKWSLRSQVPVWKAAVHRTLVHPVTSTASALVLSVKRAGGHVSKSFEMFAQVVVMPVDFLRGRSRVIGRWLYRKLFELFHNRPL